MTAADVKAAAGRCAHGRRVPREELGDGNIGNLLRQVTKAWRPPNSSWRKADAPLSSTCGDTEALPRARAVGRLSPATALPGASRAVEDEITPRLEKDLAVARGGRPQGGAAPEWQRPSEDAAWFNALSGAAAAARAIFVCGVLLVGGLVRRPRPRTPPPRRMRVRCCCSSGGVLTIWCVRRSRSCSSGAFTMVALALEVGVPQQQAATPLLNEAGQLTPLAYLLTTALIVLAPLAPRAVVLPVIASCAALYVWLLPAAARNGFAPPLDLLWARDDADAAGFLLTPQSMGGFVAAFWLPLTVINGMAGVGGVGDSLSELKSLRATAVVTTSLFFLWLLVASVLRAPTRYQFICEMADDEVCSGRDADASWLTARGIDGVDARSRRWLCSTTSATSGTRRRRAGWRAAGPTRPSSSASPSRSARTSAPPPSRGASARRRQRGARARSTSPASPSSPSSLAASPSPTSAACRATGWRSTSRLACGVRRPSSSPSSRCCRRCAAGGADGQPAAQLGARVARPLVGRRARRVRLRAAVLVQALRQPHRPLLARPAGDGVLHPVRRQ